MKTSMNIKIYLNIKVYLNMKDSLNLQNPLNRKSDFYTTWANIAFQHIYFTWEQNLL